MTGPKKIDRRGREGFQSGKRTPKWTMSATKNWDGHRRRRRRRC